MNNKDSETQYLLKRKRRAFRTYLLYDLFGLIPVKKNKLVFTSFEGDGGYCCNPRYIAEELLKRNNGYEIVWLVNDLGKEFPKGIVKVKNTFLRRAFHLATAQVWVDNSRKEFGTKKRGNQLYIQTWHAALEFKPVGKFRGKLFPKIAYIVSAYDSRLADYVISNSEWCTKLYPDMLLYNGEVLKTGSPRCDTLVTKREAVRMAVRNKYHVPEGTKVVMFAPTFRGGGQKGKREVFAEETTLDFSELTRTLKEKFGGRWYLFLRLHPQLAAQISQLPLRKKNDYMIDVSQADDMNELLCASDVLVTDYSSTAFDALCAHIPVFIYADDLEDYVKERGKLMWDMKSLPFTIALTNQELMDNVMHFDVNKYIKSVNEFQDKHGVLEDGHASGKIADVIEHFIGKN